ncbi:protein kinase-like protein [Kribbella sp. VKM Ac-2571]|nr:protein kinase-like protein [Kribbella sp. VKM Ac-2571]
MGTVWKAFDTVLHREVAVKELRIIEGLSLADRDKVRARGLREARAAAGLDHPGIVTIHDVVDEGGRPWIVMRLLPGRSLDQAVGTDGPLSPRRAAELGVRLLDALTAAHAKGVLHRDVKPQNVMLGSDGNWMLTDFGIASVAGETRTLTGTGMVTGTLGYIAPERLSGAEPGPLQDLWSLGATLYFAVGGRPAHDHEDLPAMLASVLTRDPELPKHAGPLGPVIAGLMDRDPARRLDAATARQRMAAIAGGYPTFETPTVVVPANQPTVQLGGSTKLLEQEPGPVPQNRVLRALVLLLVALNGAGGALLGLIVYGLTDGMPLGIFVGLVVAFALGGGLGAWLVPRIGRSLGLPLTLIGAALLTGGSMLAAGAGTILSSSVVSVVSAGVALVFFAGWHRVSRSLRERVVPAELLGSVTAFHRRIAVAALLIGGVVAGGFLWLNEQNDLVDGNYIVGVLSVAGFVVIGAALIAVPALKPAGPPKRGALIATVTAGLLAPLFVAGQAVAGYVGRLDDFKSAPDVCSFDVLSGDRINQVMGSSPDPENNSSGDFIDCDWKRSDESEGKDAAEFEVELIRYDTERGAVREMQRDRESATDLGKTVTDLSLGTESFRRPYDGTIDSEDTIGLTVQVRVENLVLELDLDQSESLGAPAPARLEALAADLTRELESRQPKR